jgi:hypothetical protein
LGESGRLLLYAQFLELALDTHLEVDEVVAEGYYVVAFLILS